MILEKDFDTLDSLNQFVADESVNIVSIESVKKWYYTGMPLPKGGSFGYDKEYKRLYYQKLLNN